MTRKIIYSPSCLFSSHIQSTNVLSSHYRNPLHLKFVSSCICLRISSQRYPAPCDNISTFLSLVLKMFYPKTHLSFSPTTLSWHSSIRPFLRLKFSHQKCNFFRLLRISFFKSQIKKIKFRTSSFIPLLSGPFYFRSISPVHTYLLNFSHV